MIEWQHLKIGNSRLSCPECSKGHKDKSMGVTVQADGCGIAHCFRCGYVESYAPKGVSITPGCNPITPPQSQKRSVLADNWGSLWSHSRPIQNSLAERYLSLRGCALPPDGAHLRFIPELRHPDGWAGPAMLALVTHAIDRHAMTIHRTWIQEDNPKALDRRLLGGHEKKGGVIRLWPDEYVTYGLAVAEGVETALSLASEYMPIWSLVDAGNMAAFPVLAGIETLVIGADHDEAGQKAANRLEAAWKAQGREALIIQPEHFKEDFNDMERAA